VLESNELTASLRFVVRGAERLEVVAEIVEIKSILKPPEIRNISYLFPGCQWF
jgi:hypothetical protein